MKPKQIFNTILAVLFVFPLMGTFAQQAAPSGSIEVITTFDYPGAGNLTLPQKINERGDVVGEFIDSNGVTRAFVRFSDGSFSDPIVDPKIPWVLPKDEASITHAQSAVTTPAAMATITGFSCRAAPSQNTMFPARSAPVCLG